MLNRGGFSLVEILITISIFSISALSISTAAIGVIRASTTSRRLTAAATLAQDKLEVLVARVAPLRSGEDTPRPGFVRRWQIAAYAARTGLKRIDVSIDWNDGRSRPIGVVTLVRE